MEEVCQPDAAPDKQNFSLTDLGCWLVAITNYSSEEPDMMNEGLIKVELNILADLVSYEIETKLDFQIIPFHPIITFIIVLVSLEVGRREAKLLELYSVNAPVSIYYSITVFYFTQPST